MLSGDGDAKALRSVEADGPWTAGMGSIGNLDGTGGGGTARTANGFEAWVPSEQDVRSLKDLSLWADEVRPSPPEEHLLDEPVQLVERADNYLDDYPELVAASARATSHQAHRRES